MPSPFQFFICYSVSDRVFAKTIALKLRQQSVDVFFDETDLAPGDDLLEVARQAPALIVVVSRFGIIDRKVMDIVEEARRSKRLMIPLLMEECTLPTSLKKLQMLDFVNNFEPGLKELVKTAAKYHRVVAGAIPPASARPRKNFFKSVLDSINVFKSSKEAMPEEVFTTASPGGNPALNSLDKMMESNPETAAPPPPRSSIAPQASGGAPPNSPMGSQPLGGNVPPAPSPPKGKVLYDIPDSMLLNQQSKCIVRVGKNEKIVLDDDTFSPAMRLQDVPISRVMDVSLVDIADTPRFHIKTINSSEMEVEEDSYTEWLFWVTPLSAGFYPLVLKVSVIKLIDGKERRKELVFEKEVNINTAADAPVQDVQPLFAHAQATPSFNTLDNNIKVVVADPPVVFISYAHKDKTYFDIFVDYLKSQSGWTIWTDRNIEVGSDWYERIHQAINEADVAVLLISADFISSNFIKAHEFASLQTIQQLKKGFTFLPILLRDTEFTRWQELAAMQLFVAYGDEYGVPEMKGKMIPFAQLCRFDTAGQLIPNHQIDTYFKNLVKKAEKDWLKTKV
jgi:hypothetical protein